MKEYMDRDSNRMEYQRNLQRSRPKRSAFEKIFSSGAWIVGFIVALGILGYTGSRIFATLEFTPHDPAQMVRDEKKAPLKISRAEIPNLLEGMQIGAAPVLKNYTVARNGSSLSVETTLIPPLQGYLQDLLRRSLTLKAAAVVLKPATGEILAFSEYRNGRANGSDANLCLSASYPAASLFKIVAAAAAIDARGFSPDTTVIFRGGKYTLYRSQIRPEKRPSGVTTTLTKAFASSINPVFGRVGVYSLGYSLLTEYADRFFFNRTIPFDLPLAVSPMEVPTDDFALAEVASGYNKRTFISPLHAAMLAAAVANHGTMMAPRLVQRIADQEGNLLYSSAPVGLANPVSGETARKMKTLMDETIVTGTCRKAFHNFFKKNEPKELELGAKTGTINDPIDQHRVDWVTAYAIPDSGEEDAISVSVLAVHGEKLGVRSKELAKNIMKNYFGS